MKVSNIFQDAIDGLTHIVVVKPPPAACKCDLFVSCVLMFNLNCFSIDAAHPNFSFCYLLHLLQFQLPSPF